MADIETIIARNRAQRELMKEVSDLVNPEAINVAIIGNAGKRAKEAALVAFVVNGGEAWLAVWAKKNPNDYFTKVFPKLIDRSVEIKDTRGIEDIIDQLDAEGGDLPALSDRRADPIDADFDDE